MDPWDAEVLLDAGDGGPGDQELPLYEEFRPRSRSHDVPAPEVRAAAAAAGAPLSLEVRAALGSSLEGYSQRRRWFKQAADSAAFSDLSEVCGEPSTRPTGEPAVESHALGRLVGPPSNRWHAFWQVVVFTILGTCTWFAAGAVLPQLSALWGISTDAGSLLTIGVNLGFLCGALASTLNRIPDRVPPALLMGVGSITAGVLNVLLLVPGVGFRGACVLRFGTGASMAFVYPIACKVMATWFITERGIAMGGVVGGVVLGGAAPHLVNATVEIPWEMLVIVCSILSALGGIGNLLLLHQGPHRAAKPTTAPEPPLEAGPAAPSKNTSKFTRDAMAVLQNRGACCAILGYCGHNWEIYALWQCFKEFSMETGLGARMMPSSPQRGASWVQFIVTAAGFLGTVGGGHLADKLGRTKLCLLSLGASSLASLVVGDVDNWVAVVAIGASWGVTVVSDSAQYSAMLTELAPLGLVGTALTMQLGFGYLFTMPAMYLIPALGKSVGWSWAWKTLVPGPMVAAAAMLYLRTLPDAARICNGRK